MTNEPATGSITSAPSERAYWLCQLAGWGTLAIFTVVAASLLAMSAAPELAVPWPRASLESLLLHAAALTATHYLRSIIKNQHWRAQPNPVLVRRVILVSLLLGLPFGLLQANLGIAVVRNGVADNLPSLYVVHIVNWAVTFAMWSLLYFFIVGARERRLAAHRQAEVKQALQAAELQLLKSQLNPHFLFNSLNSVRSLIADDPAAAQQAVTRLSRTLRYTLGAGEQNLVSLREELAMVEDYLQLEALRLGERLQVSMDIPDDLMARRIPVMLLQTVVENAIKHGIAELPGGGELRLTAQSDDNALLFRVDNPCPPQAAATAGEGIGLRNGAERLRLLFGESAKLDLDLSTPTLARTTLRIPQT